MSSSSKHLEFAGKHLPAELFARSKEYFAMKHNTKTLLLFLVIVAIAAVTTIATIRGQNQQSTASNQQPKTALDESQWPIADYNAPEPADPRDRALRKLRSKRYDGGGFVQESPPEDDTAVINEIEYPALPVGDSDAVVSGEVVKAQAHLSNDKKAVYSEFAIRIDEVLKNKCASMAPSNLITAERAGGRVRFPSSRIKKYHAEGQGMPRVGRQYVFFLKYNADQENYNIITAYELRGEKVFPVDGSVADKSSRKWSFDIYHGAIKERFLKDVREAIANPSQEKRRIFG
jgi:hypothetical protein